MLYLPTLLGLVATVSAIDGYFHSATLCDDRYSLLCSNMNPGVCCSRGHSPFPGNDYYGSVGFYGIPSGWNIIGSGYTGSTPGVGCQQLFSSAGNGGDSWICIGSGNENGYMGLSYVFQGSKQRRGGDAGAEPCQKPDKLLVDGVKYNIAGLEDSVVDELVRVP